MNRNRQVSYHNQYNVLRRFLEVVFKGLGQIMLQENALTGILFLVGIFIGSVTMGAAALLATVIGTLTARLIGFDKASTESGLYGFSAALTGVALVLYFKPVLLIWIFIILGAALAGLIQYAAYCRKIPVYTLPFVLVTWLLAFIVNHYFPELVVSRVSEIQPEQSRFSFPLKGFGQVIFQSNSLSGLLFFCALFISSPIAALYGLAAAVTAAIFSVLLSAQSEAISIGLYSYNAVLCAIVFAGNKISDGGWALIAVLLASIGSHLMKTHNLMELTFPFVAATLVTLLLKKLILKTKFVHKPMKPA
ncbi:MAG: urea transporter [Bacteroidia bacterium]|nr:urea transporter [Bacteroidia bacterium]MCZ2278530.1 urea transporter [Bacteroidia bacterium]